MFLDHLCYDTSNDLIFTHQREPKIAITSIYNERAHPKFPNLVVSLNPCLQFLPFGANIVI